MISSIIMETVCMFGFVFDIVFNINYKVLEIIE